MIMKKIATLIAALAVSSALSAQARLSLVFRMADGSEYVVAADGLTATVDGDKLLVSNSSGTQTIALGTLEKMYFSGEESALESPETADDVPSMRVYTAAGVYVGSYGSAAEASNALPAGIYLFQTSSGTRKYKIRAL